jgi:flagellar protein FlaG
MPLASIQNLSLQPFLPQTTSSASSVAAAEIPQRSQQTLTDAIIQFVNDQKSGRVLIQVVQPDSGEVIRQIPSEEELAITQTLGLVLDKIA